MAAAGQPVGQMTAIESALAPLGYSLKAFREGRDYDSKEEYLAVELRKSKAKKPPAESAPGQLKYKH